MEDITWVTSASRDMYENMIYGKCLRTWNNLTGDKLLYSEDDLNVDGFKTIDLSTLIDSTKFLEKKRKRVLVRFYKKALPIYHAISNATTRYIVWLDSDVEVVKQLDIFPNLKSSCSTMMYTTGLKDFVSFDTGIIIFDLEKLPKEFAQEFIDYWHTEKIYNLRNWKDTDVISDMSAKYPIGNLINTTETLHGNDNFFKYTEFSEYFYHYIGKGQK